jgi:hypothetical protein
MITGFRELFDRIDDKSADCRAVQEFFFHPEARKGLEQTFLSAARRVEGYEDVRIIRDVPGISALDFDGARLMDFLGSHDVSDCNVKFTSGGNAVYDPFESTIYLPRELAPETLPVLYAYNYAYHVMFHRTCADPKRFANLMTPMAGIGIASGVQRWVANNEENEGNMEAPAYTLGMQEFHLASAYIWATHRTRNHLSDLSVAYVLNMPDSLIEKLNIEAESPSARTLGIAFFALWEAREGVGIYRELLEPGHLRLVRGNMHG